MGFWIEIGDWELEIGNLGSGTWDWIRYWEWDWRFGIRIGDWDCGLRLWIGIDIGDRHWRFGIWDCGFGIRNRVCGSRIGIGVWGF